MFAVLSIPILAVSIIAILFVTNTYGVNKTVGWAWDLTNLQVLAFPLYFVYWLGYGAISLMKIKTNYRISIVHFITILLSFVYLDNLIIQNIIALIIVISFVLFIANIGISFTNHIKLKRS